MLCWRTLFTGTYTETGYHGPFERLIKVVGHPARSAARLRVEIELEICHLTIKIYGRNCASNLSRERDCPYTASSQCAICGDVCMDI